MVIVSNQLSRNFFRLYRPSERGSHRGRFQYAVGATSLRRHSGIVGGDCQGRDTVTSDCAEANASEKRNVSVCGYW